MTIFKDRRDAGRKLAEKLASYRDTDAIVVALPRGGIIVGHEIACDLSLPLDIIAVRKVGHPASSEYAIGAVDEYGTHLINKEEVAQIDEAWLEREIESEIKEARRRSLLYRKGLDILDLAGRTIIVVDDGIAAGYTMEVALMAIKKHWPRKIIVAVPVVPPDIARRLIGEVDKFITLTDPNEFRGAVGSHYGEFQQVDDEEVVGLLHSSSFLERNMLASAHARYLDTKAHTFMSVDPMLYKLPDSYLRDPQQMNSYAYARNNPIVYTDPTGEIGWSTLTNIPSGIMSGLGSIAKDLYSIISSPIQTGQAMGQSVKSAISNPSIITSAISRGINNFKSSSDANQGKIIGSAVAGFVIPETKGLGLSSELRNGARVLSGSEKPASVFHYTNEKGLNGILNSGEIRPSTFTANPKDARLGDGQYFSDIQPGSLSNMDLGRMFKRVPNERIFTHYLEVSTDGLDVVGAANRPGVYLIPNMEPLKIFNRIINYGEN